MRFLCLISFALYELQFTHTEMSSSAETPDLEAFQRWVLSQTPMPAIPSTSTAPMPVIPTSTPTSDAYQRMTAASPAQTVPMPTMPILHHLQNTANVKTPATLVHMDHRVEGINFEDVMRTFCTEHGLGELYQELKGMNLEDDDSMDNIYLNSPAFVDTSYFYQTLLSSYREKYAKLFEDVSIKNYITILLAILLFQGVDKLKSYLKSASEQSVDLGNFKIPIKRKRAGAPIVEESKVPKNDAIKHPLLKLACIQSKPYLLKLGDMLSIITPSSLVPLRAKVKYTTVKRQVSAQVSEEVNGLDVIVDPPTIVLLEERVSGQYTFIECSPIPMTDILKKTNYNVYDNWLNYGLKKKLVKVDINNSLNQDNKYSFAPINRFNVAANSKNDISGKCYSDVRMYLYPDSLTVNPDTMVALEKTINAAEAQLEKDLDEYDKVKN